MANNYARDYIVYPNLNPYHHLQTLPKQNQWSQNTEKPAYLVKV
eukprot:COSAG05_NODE_18596_length_306_cov_0.714976_2_plen_44_part_01